MVKYQWSPNNRIPLCCYSLVRHSTQMPAAAPLQIVYFELCAFTFLLPFISFVRVTIVIQLFVDLFLKLLVLLVLFSPF
jgi:hypothetical protein